MSKMKFKVGETVRMVGAPHIKVFILETQGQTCYANCQQNWYTGRVIYSSPRSVVGKIERFSEIELEKCPEPSKKVLDMRKKLKELQKSKNTLIKSQDFEKAAAARDEFKKVKMELELQEELEGLREPDEFRFDS